MKIKFLPAETNRYKKMVKFLLTEAVEDRLTPLVQKKNEPLIESSYGDRASLLDFDDEPKKSVKKSRKDSDADQLRDIQSKLDEFEKSQPQFSRRTSGTGMDDAEIDSSIHRRQNPRRDADLRQLRDIQSKLDEFEKRPLFGDKAKRKRDELAQYLGIGSFSPTSRQLETQQEELVDPQQRRESDIIGIVSDIEEIYIKAIRENNEDLIEKLAEKGYEVSDKVIEEAVFRDRLSIIQYFYSIGFVSPIKVVNKALFYGNVRIFKYFYKMYNFSQTSLNSFFEDVVMYKDINLFATLIQLAKDKGELNSKFLFYLSLRQNFLKGIDYLFEKNIIDFETIFQDASTMGNLEAIKYFVENKSISQSLLNQSLLWTIDSKHTSFSVIKYFVEKGANNLNEALLHSAERGHINIVKYFVEKGANNLNEALLHSAERGHINIVEYFVEKGINSLESLKEALEWVYGKDGQIYNGDQMATIKYLKNEIEKREKK